MKNLLSISDEISKYTSKDIVPSIYSGNGEEWASVLDGAFIPSPHYNWSNIVYQNAYFTAELEYKNLPIIFHTRGKPIAVFPIAVLTHDGVSKIVSNGGPIYPPVILEQVFDREEKTVIEICEKILGDLSANLNVTRNEYQVKTSSNGLSTWCAGLVETARVIRVGQLLDVDLGMSLEQIKSTFRKSYKPLINKGLKKWEVDVIEGGNPAPFWEYKNLHVAVAGRETRCLASWDAQLDMLNRGDAFLVTLRDETNELVGAGLFVYNSQCGLYGSAAYRRDLFAEPLGHVVQYKALEVMLSKGLKRYEIGYGFSELYGATTKEVSITKFKSGFCNEVGVIMHLEKQVSIEG
ncbi:hypothetical protein [Vibrio metoecus]|uniref:FemAB family protein n=1 Tax=Vibrio metoecus TaxID=1481663 RepID=A0A271VP64_VIBMT|nr:hypothetical protein [Vibrio metoecus]PAR19737.1 hypothetical protein CGU03_15440 [Vibrio metoecus]PAR23754.1 hypothetical protein CGU02_13195 [Vibrio metoecus]PAR27110.1 hypothetical protein CGU00_15295 [Vibrio metoecus]PAR35691.1 hypothetical protein CGT97_09985 [Vibrio metoecus]PAR44177.1 hypothetical protein CGT96_03585 [Vibrio metoecus]